MCTYRRSEFVLQVNVIHNPIIPILNDKTSIFELPSFLRSRFLWAFSIAKKLILQQWKAPLIPQIKECFNELSDLTEFKVAAIYIYIN